MDAPPPLPPIERLTELMHDAARMGREDMIPALLQAGVDVEALDAKGHSPLVLASYHGHAGATALLLDAGARPDGDPASRANTALMGVAFKGHGAVVRLLLDAGAEVDRRNGGGQTALMMAALFGHHAIVDALLAAGADRDATDDSGNTAAALARAQGNAAMAERLDAPRDMVQRTRDGEQG